jgi:putative transposase
MREDLNAELVIEAVQMAVWRRRPVACLVQQPDEGSQHTSSACGAALREAGIVQSLGSVGDANDNALAESFIATLTTELVDRRS